ncbi:hypothetical protein HMPREF9413_5151 [Paenibacillus sp. HGF7]|nr:hypothetical protein HMPREF9413_5151 [Paenibacillus sp. HGF7]
MEAAFSLFPLQSGRKPNLHDFNPLSLIDGQGFFEILALRRVI